MIKNDNIDNIEECLKFLFREKISLEKRHVFLLESLRTQIFKSIALTDRQYSLLKKIILESYKQYFIDQHIDIESAVNKLGLPLRQIDRSRTVSLVKSKDYKTRFKCDTLLKIKFPFNKKILNLLNDKLAIKYKFYYYHAIGSHEHFFVPREEIIEEIVENFKERNFHIDQEIINFYNEIKKIKNNKKEYIPMIVNNKYFNIDEKMYKSLSQEQIIDRSRRLGLLVEQKSTKPGLLGEIINRKTANITIQEENYNIKKIAESLNYLDRFPLLIVLNEKNCEHELKEFYQAFKDVVLDKEQTVLFRASDEFNKFIKEKKLNNWLDEKTKITYISGNKLPKLLIESWKPIAAIAGENVVSQNVSIYINDSCDLIIKKDSERCKIKW